VRTHEEVRTRDGRLAAEAESVSVKHDDVARMAVALSDADRTRLDAALAAEA
jgi:hypothetical protein